MDFHFGLDISPVSGMLNWSFSGAALDLDFAGNRLYGLAAFTNLTCTRASTGYAETVAGTLTSFAANTLRQTNKGLLVEEARTNLSIRSQEFDNASWTKSNTTATADQTAAPDGTTTADLFTENTSNTTHLVQSTAISFTSGTTYVGSAYVKAGTATVVQLTFGVAAFSGAGYADFNLSAGTVSSTGGTLAGSGIQALGNGWYRVWISAVATATAGAELLLVLTNNNATATRGPTYTGTSATLYAWGTQVEAGAFVTSYVPTTTASVTRAADVVNLLTSSIPSFSATAGTLYAEGSPHYASAGASVFPTLVSLDDSTANERFTLYRSDSNNAGRFAVVDGGGNQAVIAGVAWTDTSSHKLALAFAANDISAADNGTLGTPDTSATLPTVTRLTFGLLGTSAHLNGYLKRVAYWPTRQTNTTLQAVTTP